MSELAERVACAICKADGLVEDDKEWAVLPANLRRGYFKGARAAIKAIGIPQDILERLASGELTTTQLDAFQYTRSLID